MKPPSSTASARSSRLIADCFDRTCRPGHITAAAWILSADRRRSLLTHHRKLDRWLQLGGHADGQWHVEEVALREAREESGLTRFDIVPIDGVLMPFDVDVHEIPARYDAARPTDRRRPRTPRHSLPLDRRMRATRSASATNRTTSPGARPTKSASSPTKKASCGCSARRWSYSIDATLQIRLTTKDTKDTKIIRQDYGSTDSMTIAT